MKLIHSIVFLLFLSPVSLFAQDISDLDWMKGYWTHSENGVTMEELWTSESGGMLLGLHRDVFENRGSSFEFLRIIQQEEKIVYLASPGGRAPISFTLKELGNQKVIFENLEHDFPQRLIYTRNGDELSVRIEDASGKKNMQWIWKQTPFNTN